MQISSRFTIAVHVLICIETFKNDYKVTSDFLASSVNVNPVVIRRLLQQLKKAGIINVKRGSGGADIKKRLDDLGIENSMTRTGDETLGPNVRPERAQSFYGNGKDVIVLSNHINAGGDKITEKRGK